MRILVRSLKRLYEDGKVSKEQILERYDKKILSYEECVEILGAHLEGTEEKTDEENSTEL